jgi:iron complex outermembrane receptor protein
VYGNFPSASVGWRISKEKFMEELNFVNNLKVRVSWGITGNDRIPRNVWEQTYNPNQDYVLGNDITVVGGYDIFS